MTLQHVNNNVKYAFVSKIPTRMMHYGKKKNSIQEKRHDPISFPQQRQEKKKTVPEKPQLLYQLETFTERTELVQEQNLNKQKRRRGRGRRERERDCKIMLETADINQKGLVAVFNHALTCLTRSLFESHDTSSDFILANSS